MPTVIVRYRLKPECAAENRALIDKVFAELHASNPPGLHYSVFRGSDSVTHFHVATVDPAAGENPLRKSPAFAAFSANVADRCVEPPAPMDVEQIAAYQFNLS